MRKFMRVIHKLIRSRLLPNSEMYIWMYISFHYKTKSVQLSSVCGIWLAHPPPTLHPYKRRTRTVANALHFMFYVWDDGQHVCWPSRSLCCHHRPSKSNWSARQRQIGFVGLLWKLHNMHITTTTMSSLYTQNQPLWRQVVCKTQSRWQKQQQQPTTDTHRVTLVQWLNRNHPCRAAHAQFTFTAHRVSRHKTTIYSRTPHTAVVGGWVGSVGCFLCSIFDAEWWTRIVCIECAQRNTFPKVVIFRIRTLGDLGVGEGWLTGGSVSYCVPYATKGTASNGFSDTKMSIWLCVCVCVCWCSRFTKHGTLHAVAVCKRNAFAAGGQWDCVFRLVWREMVGEYWLVFVRSVEHGARLTCGNIGHWEVKQRYDLAFRNCNLLTTYLWIVFFGKTVLR